MHWQLCPGQDFAICRVNDRKSPTPVSNDEPTGGWVNPDVVCIVTEIRRRSDGEILASEQTHRSITRAGNCDDIGLRRVADALGFVQASEAVNNLTARDVDDLDCIVAQLRDEQVPARQIDSHVVDTAGDVLELNRLLKDECRFRGSDAAAAGEGRDSQHKERNPASGGHAAVPFNSGPG
jgi:hypothetical protein